MQIIAVTLHRFKRFDDCRIDLQPGVSLLAGPNNSGKSTILHGLAVWEYCKTILEMEKGRVALMPNSRNQGLGVGDDEFSPISIPSLRHLWTNLKSQKIREKDGYSLWINVEWKTEQAGDIDYLKIGLSLANDRLFIKTLDSTITKTTVLPTLAYITPFAGIQPQEPKYTPAQIRRFIGQGLPGSVLRNILLQLKETNDAKRVRAKEGRAKLKTSFLTQLRETDPYEQLQRFLRDIFSYGITVKDFNELYHTVIRVETYRGWLHNNRFKRLNNYTARDLMVEGSGFLQWLTVLAIALAPETSTLLLDEPDAHLHSSLQQILLSEMHELSRLYGKQVLFTTHSTDLIKSMDLKSIIRLRSGRSPKYIATEVDRTAVIEGLGSSYSPRLHKIQTLRRILFVDNESDARILETVAKVINVSMSTEFVVWAKASRHTPRKHIFQDLCRDIDGLRAVSIVDRDTDHYNTVTTELCDLSESTAPDGFLALKWRRRNIESYLLSASAIARASDTSFAEVSDHLARHFSVTEGGTWPDQSEPQPIRDLDGKWVYEDHDQSIVKAFKVNKYDVANSLEPEDVPRDLEIAIASIRQHFS